MSNPFDYVKAINEKKPVDNMVGYNPYLTNMALSYALDGVLLANEMNFFHGLPPECQFEFLYGGVRKGRRWSKWYKEEENPHVEIVMEYFGYSKQKALEALQVLTQENIRDIKKLLDKGGR